MDNFSLNFDYNIYIICIYLTAVIAAIYFIKLYKVKMVRVILIIRLFFFSLLIFILSNPKITIISNEVNKLKWNIYLDKSLSMNYHQQPSPASYRFGTNAILEKLKKKQVELNLFSFGNYVDKGWDYQNQKFQDGSTNLGDVISHIRINNDNIAGSLIISDGQENFGQKISKGNGVGLNTIHVIGVGADESLVDIMVNSVIAPPTVIKGEKAEVKVEITASGILNEKINVTLLSNEKILGSKLVNISGFGSKKEVRFLISPFEMGEIDYTVQASTLPEEVNIFNNKQIFSIQVLKDTYRVAMITGAPNFNTRILKNIIQKNKNFLLDHYVFTPKKYLKPIQEFWETNYDLVIFDNNPIEQNKIEWQNFLRVFAKKILSQKTSFALFPGYDVDKKTLSLYLNLLDLRLKSPLIALDDKYLWDINPNWSSFFPFATDNIRPLDDFDIPPLYVNMEIDSSDADVLASFTLSEVKIPLIIIKDKHPLRGLIFTSPDLNRLFYGGNNQSQIADNNIFTPIFSWLMKTGSGNEFYFRTDKNIYHQGEQIVIIGKSVNKNKKLINGVINIFNGEEKINSKQIDFNPETNLYTGKFWASKSGKLDYEILSNNDISTINIAKGSIKVQDSQIELNNVFLNKNSLIHLTTNTGGTFAHWNDKNEVIDKINAISREDLYKSIIYLKSNKVLLFLLFVFLISEWLLRRRVGLL